MQATLQSLSAAHASGKLSPKDQAGANILISKHRYYGNWSAAQQQWADDIVRRGIDNGAGLPETKPLTIGAGFAQVIALLNVAGSKLVKPTITLLDDADEPVAITLLTKRNEVVVKRPVKPGSKYGALLARVNAKGQYYETNEMTVAAADLLERLGEDTTGTALQNARKTGLCCFCSKKLTDETSTLRGYGETCAKNYGLPY